MLALMRMCILLMYSSGSSDDIEWPLNYIVGAPKAASSSLWDWLMVSRILCADVNDDPVDCS